MTLTFPAGLSTASFHDLKDYLELFLRKAKRQTEQRPSEVFKEALKNIPGEE